MRLLLALMGNLLFLAVAMGQCQAHITGLGNQTVSCGSQLVGSASGGVAPYTYSWAPASGLSAANIAAPLVIASGTYTLTISDSQGCADTETVTVTVTVLDQMADAGPDRTKCEGAPITISPPNNGVSTNGALNGTGPYTYSWSPSTGLSNPNILAPVCSATATTVYTLTVTDANGCTDTDNMNVMVTPSSVASLTSNATLTTFNGVPTFYRCGTTPNSLFNFTDPGGSTVGSNYLISWGDGSPDLSATAAPSPAQHTYAQGIYTLTYTITDANGCVSTVAYQVFYGSNPAVGLGNPGNTNICAPDSLSFPITGTANNALGTIYTVTFNDGSPPVTFSHPPPPWVTHVFAVGSCGTTSSDGSNQYANSYQANIVATNPCSMSSSTVVPIYVNTTPVAGFIISPADTICANTTVTFANTTVGDEIIGSICDSTPAILWRISPSIGWTVSSGPLGNGFGYDAYPSSWDPGAWVSGTSSLGVTFTTPGTYDITMLAGVSCGADSITRSICVEAPPVPDFTLSPLVGCSPLVANTVNNSNTANSCLVTRTWTSGQVTQGCAPQPGTVAFNAQATAPQFTFTGQGTYQVTLTLENSCGAFDQTVQPITVNAPPVIDQASLASICAGGGCVDPSAITQPCGTPVTVYGWTFPGGVPVSSSLQVPGQVCYSVPGNYTITASATNSCGTTSDPITLSVNTLPLVNAGPDVTVCAGTAGTLSGSASGGAGSYTYSWSPSIGLSDPSIADPTVTVMTTTTYTLTVTDGGGCEGADQVTAHVNQPATANAGGPYVTCGNDPVNISATSNGPGQWSAPVGTGTFASATSNSTTFTPASSAPTLIILTWTTNDPDAAEPCSSISSTADLTINAPSTAAINGPYTGCSDAPLNISASTNAPGTWSTAGSGTFADASTASTSYQPGPSDGGSTFAITWTTTDPDGNGPCQPATASTNVTINLAATANAGGDYVTCGTDPVSLHAVANGPGQWTAPAGIFANSTSANTTFTPTSGQVGTTFTITWSTTDPDAAGPCSSATSTANVTVTPPPTAVVTGGGVHCSSAPNPDVIFTFTGTGPWTFSYFDGTNTTTIPDHPFSTYTISNASNGTYTITALAEESCPGTIFGNAVIVSTSPAATADAGGPYITCGTSAIAIAALANGTGAWTSVGNIGSFDPPDTAISAYTYPNVVTVLTTQVITWTTDDPDGNGPCPNVSDTALVFMNPPATATLPAMASVCSNASLTLNATTNDPGAWSGGAGTYADQSSASTTYTPASSEAGTIVTLTWTTVDPDGNGPCTAASAAMLVTVNAEPVVLAGNDTTLCLEGTPLVLAPTPAGGSWLSGVTNGSFTPTAAGTFALIYTYTDGNNCTDSDTLAVVVNDPATADAGGPYLTCGTSTIGLNAITNGAGGWSGGAGSFTDSAEPNTSYTPAFSEVGTTVALTWSTFDPDGFGPCPGASDTAELTISTPATALVGGPYTVCSNSVADINVTTTPGSGAWAGGIGTILDPADTTTSYTPAPSESGTTVAIIWTTIDPDGSGPCPVVTDTAFFDVLAAATADAGGPYEVCGTYAVAINATANSAGEWTGGAGSFTDSAEPNTSYTPALSEVGTTITLTWSTFDPDGAGPCPSASDTAELTISTPATALVGGPYTVCSNSVADISVTTTPGAGAWAGGVGIIEDPADTNTSYTPAQSESGTTVAIVWTTDDPDGSGPCPVVTDTAFVAVLAAATADAGGPYDVCGTNTVAINATANSAGEWTGGTGSFTNSAEPNTSYTPTLSEVGTIVALTWSTFDPDGFGPCPSASDTAELTISTPATVLAGGPYTVCSNSVADINVTTTPGAGAWAGGIGTILDPADTTTSYTPASTESGTTVAIFWTTIDPDGSGPCPVVTDTAFVAVLTAATADAGGPYVTCGPDLVSISAVTNGTGSWSGGVGTFAINTDTQTIYTADPSEFGANVVLTWTTDDPDGSGPCPDASDTALLVVHDLPVADAGGDATVACGDTLHGSAIQGLPGYSYSWTPITGIFLPTSPSTPVIATGAYTLLVTDANGCSDTDTANIIVTGLEDMAVVQDTSMCMFQTVQLTGAANGGTAPHIFLWTPATALSATNIPDPICSSTDTITYVLTVTDQVGCVDADSLTVIVFPLPVVNAGADISLCTYAPLQTLDGFSPLNGVWNPAQTFMPDTLAIGADPFYYTYTDPVTQCPNTDSLLVTVNEVPVTGFSAPDTACINTNVLFSNQTTCPTCGLLSYVWDFGDGSAGSSLLSPQHTYLDSGTYVITLITESGFGCSDTAMRAIRIIKVPEVAFGFTPSNGCGPLLVTLDNTSLGLPINYHWDIETFGTSSSADPGPITFPQAPCDSIYYTIALSASNQCGTVNISDSVKVFSVPDPHFVLNTDTICSPGTAQAFNATTCAWQTTYTWLFGDGETLVSQAPLVSHPYSADSIPLFVPITLIAENTCGMASDTDTLLVIPNTVHAFFNANPLIGCEPLLVQFIQSGLGITDWAWDFGDGSSSLLQDPTHLYLNDGTYAAVLHASNGCFSDSISQVITVLPGPVFDLVADPDSICAGNAIQFTSVGTNLTGYQWSFGDGAVASEAAPVHSYAEAGVFTVQLICNSTVMLCPDTVQHPVWVLPNPVASFTAAPLEGCIPLQVNIQDNSQFAGQYEWNFGDGNTSGFTSPSTTYATPGTYTIELVVTAANGCEDSSATTITAHPTPIADFTFTLDTLPDPILPTQFNNLSTGALSYVWTFGDGQGSTQYEPAHQYVINSTCSYSPMLAVYNEFQCSDTTVRLIAVPRDVRVFVPNAFSPDGNGLNDDFIVEGVDWMYSSVQFDIFDRWGNDIYSQNGGQPRWNGMVNGVPAMNDVYVWRLKIRQTCGYDEQTILGHVTLIR